MVNPPLKEFCGYLQLERRIGSRVPAVGGQAFFFALDR
jgi:hypothetical protein